MYAPAGGEVFDEAQPPAGDLPESRAAEVALEPASLVDDANEQTLLVQSCTQADLALPVEDRVGCQLADQQLSIRQQVSLDAICTPASHHPSRELWGDLCTRKLNLKIYLLRQLRRAFFHPQALPRAPLYPNGHRTEWTALCLRARRLHRWPGRFVAKKARMVAVEDVWCTSQLLCVSSRTVAVAG